MNLNEDNRRVALGFKNTWVPSSQGAWKKRELTGVRRAGTQPWSQRREWWGMVGLRNPNISSRMWGEGTLGGPSKERPKPSSIPRA